MRFLGVVGLSAMSVLAGLGSARAETAVATVTATATFDSRTSLVVSSRDVQFHVGEDGQPSMASVEFIAAARTRTGGEVLLMVEPERTIQVSGGAADVETHLSFEGQGAGTSTGLPSSGRALAGRWIGSGRRTGRLRFVLRATAPGVYVVPIRFVLSAP